MNPVYDAVHPRTVRHLRFPLLFMESVILAQKQNLTRGAAPSEVRATEASILHAVRDVFAGGAPLDDVEDVQLLSDFWHAFQDLKPEPSEAHASIFKQVTARHELLLPRLPEPNEVVKLEVIEAVQAGCEPGADPRDAGGRKGRSGTSY